MYRPRPILTCAASTIACLGWASPEALGQLQFRLVPVQPQGLETAPYPEGTVISGTTIVIPGGAPRRVWIEFRFSGWASVGDGTLRVVHATSDPAPFVNGVGGAIQPAHVPCASADDCINEVGQDAWPGGQCNGGTCTHMFQQARPDGLPSPGPWIAACAHEYPGLNCGAASIGPTSPDDGTEHYAATAVLDIPPDAAGTYTLGLSEGEFYIETGDNTDHTPNVVPAVITICEPSECGGPKVRFLSYGAGAASARAGVPAAVRVKLIDALAFPAATGLSYWLAPPTQITDGATGEVFFAARLQCAPNLRDWTPNYIVHIYGPEVVPNSTYEIRYADAACVALGEESCMSDPQIVRTGRWGDIREPYYSAQNTFQPNALDISAIVDKFLERPGAPSRTRTKLFGAVPDPNTVISFLDIGALVDAYKGKPYSFTGPTACP